MFDTYRTPASNSRSELVVFGRTQTKRRDRPEGGFIAWPLALLLVCIVALTAHCEFPEGRHPHLAEGCSVSIVRFVKIFGTADQKQSQSAEISIVWDGKPLWIWCGHWSWDWSSVSGGHCIYHPIRHWITSLRDEYILDRVTRQNDRTCKLVAPFSLRSCTFETGNNFKERVALFALRKREKRTQVDPRLCIDGSRLTSVDCRRTNEHLTTVGYWMDDRNVANSNPRALGFNRDLHLCNGSVCCPLHLTTLVTSERSVTEQDHESQGFDWLSPRFVLNALINLLGIAVAAVLTLMCAASGLSIVKYQVPRQPDRDAAWFTLWVGIAILGVGQLCALFAIYLVGWWL